jgi:hypothetical protein
MISFHNHWKNWHSSHIVMGQDLGGSLQRLTFTSLFEKCWYWFHFLSRNF